jgi:hypothetical protein
MRGYVAGPVVLGQDTDDLEREIRLVRLPRRQDVDRVQRGQADRVANDGAARGFVDAELDCLAAVVGRQTPDKKNAASRGVDRNSFERNI